MSKWGVKVFCGDCGDVFWEGSLIDWAIELSKRNPPKWFGDARKHEQNPNHTIMVKYPSQTVTLDLSKERIMG